MTFIIFILLVRMQKILSIMPKLKINLNTLMEKLIKYFIKIIYSKNLFILL